MKSLIFGCALALQLLLLPAHGSKPILSGNWIKISSEHLQEDRAIAVYLPPSYQENANASYPVLYVLDGDETRLRGISGLVESLSSENLEKQIPEFIIIAIPNTDRIRDLTPTNSNIVFGDRTTNEWPTSGGANKFLSFFSKELIPYIEDNYRVNNIRTLVGSSYGGLFSWNALLTQNDVFSHYLVTDSNYIWDANVISRIADEALENKPDLKGEVFVSFANNTAFGEMGQANYGWGRDLEKALKANGVRVQSIFLENETHGTAEFLTWYHGLLSLFGRQKQD